MILELTNVSPLIPPDIMKLVEKLTDGVLDQVLMLDSQIEHQALVNGCPVEQLEGCRALAALILYRVGEALYLRRAETHPKLGNYHVDNLSSQVNKLLNASMEDVT